MIAFLKEVQEIWVMSQLEKKEINFCTSQLDTRLVHLQGFLFESFRMSHLMQHSFFDQVGNIIIQIFLFLL